MSRLLTVFLSTEFLVMARAEKNKEGFLFGHISALSVSPAHRQRGLAKRLMTTFEPECDRMGCYYIDLFVRPSNKIAVGMYQRLGYAVYRTVLDYYEGKVPEDAYGKNIIYFMCLDMRKSLGKDACKKFMTPLKNPVHASKLE